jgi:hypothetical protein
VQPRRLILAAIARLPPAASGRRAGRPGADPPDPLGRHREQLRPDDEVRPRDPAAHRLYRGAAAPLYLRDHSSGPRRDARGRRAQRSIFLARSRDLQGETESRLNVWVTTTASNKHIRFGKRGELASNRREEQDLGMLCLHILQSSLGLINTLKIQDTLALPEWANVLTDTDRRGLTRVFHTNMTPYGEVQIRTDRRLDLTGIPPSAA